MKKVFYLSITLLSFTSLWSMGQTTRLTADQIEQLVRIFENSSTSIARNAIQITEQPNPEVEREKREKLLRLQVKFNTATTDQERAHYLDKMEELESRARKYEEIRTSMVEYSIRLPERLLCLHISTLVANDKAVKHIAQYIKNIVIYKPQLFAALETNNEQQVRLLLQKVPYAVKDHDGNTLLHKTAKYCSPELVGLILKLNIQAITARNIHDQTPVDVALSNNRLDTVELFTKLAYAAKSTSKSKPYFTCSIV